VDGCEPFADFDSAVFNPPTEIDNKWFPLRPGTQFTLMGQSDRGDGIQPAILVFTPAPVALSPLRAAANLGTDRARPAVCVIIDHENETGVDP